MAKRRSYKRDRNGRFASSASRSTKVKRAVPTRVVSRKVRVGRVGPGGEYVGVRAGVELKPKRGRSRYYVGVSAGSPAPFRLLAARRLSAILGGAVVSREGADHALSAHRHHSPTPWLMDRNVATRLVRLIKEDARVLDVLN